MWKLIKYGWLVKVIALTTITDEKTESMGILKDKLSFLEDGQCSTAEDNNRNTKEKVLVSKTYFMISEADHLVICIG